MVGGSLRLMSAYAIRLAAQLILQALDHGVGFGLEGVLDLDLQHQLAAALEIQPQVDVLLPVRHQLVFGGRQADDAVDTRQNDDDDHQDLDFEIALSYEVSS